MNEDEKIINALYTSLEAETPSKELDDKVLQEAKQHLPPQSQWRKWQWPASIAASVVFVSVILFTQYASFSPNLEESIASVPQPVDPFELANQATLDKQQLAEAQKMRRQEADILEQQRITESAERLTSEASSLASKSLADIETFTAETLAEPAPANFAQNEVPTLAARALDNVEIDVTPFENIAPPKVDADLEVEQDLLVVTGSRPAETEMSEDVEAIVVSVSGVKLAPEDKQVASAFGKTSEQASEEAKEAEMPMLESDYLNQLLTDFEKINAQIKVLAASQSEKRKILQGKLQNIQQTAYDHLTLQRLAEPNQQIPAKYLDMLSVEQRIQLVPNLAED